MFCYFASRYSRSFSQKNGSSSTGIFAAITAIGSDDPLTTKSCALCAAVNTVAIVHYFFSSALGSCVGPVA